jgi:hypothetical protein
LVCGAFRPEQPTLQTIKPNKLTTTIKAPGVLGKECQRLPVVVIPKIGAQQIKKKAATAATAATGLTVSLDKLVLGVPLVLLAQLGEVAAHVSSVLKNKNLKKKLADTNPGRRGLPELEQLHLHLKKKIDTNTRVEKKHHVSVRVPAVATVNHLQGADAADDTVGLLRARVSPLSLELA